MDIIPYFKYPVLGHPLFLPDKHLDRLMQFLIRYVQLYIVFGVHDMHKYIVFRDEK
jgi:hypothetical protein